MNRSKKIEELLTPIQRNRILAKGIITVHKEFKRFVKPGGMLHIRIVDPSLKRAIVFKLYHKVKFPLQYKITGANILTPSRFDAVFNTEFYVDAFYRQRDEEATHCPGGEAWGKAGKLYLLKPGDTANVLINFFWTPELLKGTLKKPKNAISSMWVDVKDDLKDLVTKKNKLTILIKTTDQDNQEIILAKKELKNIKVDDLPIPVHFYRGDFFKLPHSLNTKGFFEGFLELADQKKYIIGGRASKWIQIDVCSKGLRLILHRKTKDISYITKTLNSFIGQKNLKMIKFIKK